MSGEVLKLVNKSRVVLITLMLFASQPVISGQALLGHWDCMHGNERHSLQFISANQLRFDGEISSYMLMFNSLVVEEDGGIVSYPVELQGDSLTVTNPDASVTRCKRGRGAPPESTTASTTARSPGPAGQSHPAPKGRLSWPPYVKPDPPPGGYTGNETGLEYLVWKFAGRWAHVSPNTLTNLYFKPDGTYEDAYEAGYSGDFQDQSGYQTGSWGAAGSEKGAGRWWPEGTLHEGKIHITKHDGSQTVLNYRIQHRHGKYYPGEYYFNEKLYTVNYIYR